MGTFTVGQVVLLPFPFSDLTVSKRRPALLLADAGRRDWVLCQITSKPYADPRAICILEEDFSDGGLSRISYVRAAKLITAHYSLFQARAGTLPPMAHQKVVDSVIHLIGGGSAAENQP
jgi:mRNA interferase MazF